MICLIHSLITFLLCVTVVFSTDKLARKGTNTCISSDAAAASSLQGGPRDSVEGKVRWAVIALARPGRPDVVRRNTQLIQLMKPYSHLHNITAIFFSEEAFPLRTLSGWIEDFKDVGHVRIIDTSTNGFNAPERYGYKYMCKFFALDVYDYLRNDYDYYLRCDTDCFISPLKYDILQWAKDSNIGYGFSMRKMEAHQPTRKTLPLWTDGYMERCGLEASAPMDRGMRVCFNFYNNFHIGRVDFFLRPDVQHYLRAANASGHILSHRWGDSTIQAYAVRLFMSPSAIVQVPDFSYVHGSHADRVVSTFGDGSLTTVPQRLPNWKYVPQ